MSDSVSPSDAIMAAASSALRAQQSRMRVIAENMANSDSVAKTAGGDPYRRQMAADAKGNVKLPNVDPLMEAMDMRDAQRAYEANLNVIDTDKAMQTSLIQLLQK